MGAVIALVATLVALAFAALPLLRHRAAETSEATALADLMSQRDLALDDIRELDFDRDLGNLSDEDHAELRDTSKRKAVAILKQLNVHDAHLDDDIETAIASLRHAGNGSAPHDA